MLQYRDILVHLRALQWFYLSCHWSSGGPTSYSDHLLFERLYKALEEPIDRIGERMVSHFGVSSIDPVAVNEDVCKLLRLTVKQKDPVRAGLELEDSLVDSIDRARKLKDTSFGLENFLADLADRRDEAIYLLERRTQKLAKTNPSFLRRPAWLGGPAFPAFRVLVGRQQYHIANQADWQDLKSKLGGQAARYRLAGHEYGTPVFREGAAGASVLSWIADQARLAQKNPGLQQAVQVGRVVAPEVKGLAPKYKELYAESGRRFRSVKEKLGQKKYKEAAGEYVSGSYHHGGRVAMEVLKDTYTGAGKAALAVLNPRWGKVPPRGRAEHALRQQGYYDFEFERETATRRGPALVYTVGRETAYVGQVKGTDSIEIIFA